MTVPRYGLSGERESRSELTVPETDRPAARRDLPGGSGYLRMAVSGWSSVTAPLTHPPTHTNSLGGLFGWDGTFPDRADVGARNTRAAECQGGRVGAFSEARERERENSEGTVFSGTGPPIALGSE